MAAATAVFNEAVILHFHLIETKNRLLAGGFLFEKGTDSESLFQPEIRTLKISLDELAGIQKGEIRNEVT